MFNPATEFITVYNGVISDNIAFNKKVHAFLIGIGSKEGQRMKSFSDVLKKKGIHNT